MSYVGDQESLILTQTRQGDALASIIRCLFYGGLLLLVYALEPRGPYREELRLLAGIGLFLAFLWHAGKALLSLFDGKKREPDSKDQE